MAKPRNYWVLRGMRGAAARTNLLNYYTGVSTRPSRIGTRGPRPASQALYITPFSIPLATDHVLRVSALAPAWTALSAIAPTQQHVTATLGTDTAVRIKSYKAPRITRIQLDPTGTVTTADITGLEYMKYDNTSQSIPFGKNLVADTVAAVAADLIAAYSATAGFAARLTPERA
jgi:hypothetical protein